MSIMLSAVFMATSSGRHTATLNAVITMHSTTLSRIDMATVWRMPS